MKKPRQLVLLPAMTPTKQRLVDNAPSSLDVRERLHQHTVLAQTVLPYRNPGDDKRVWERQNGAVSLRIEAGAIINPRTGKYVEVGLPYGPKARLIVMHVNQEAIEKQTPFIDVEKSLTAFVKRNGLAPHGRNIRTVTDQLGRLSTSTIRLGMFDGIGAQQFNGQIVSGFEIWCNKDERQQSLWPQHIRLSHEYFVGLIEHAIPLSERAVIALSHSSMAMDIYAWLVQRLHRIEGRDSVRVTWPQLHEQFGPDYARLRKFREVFITALTQVHTQYRDAKVDVHEGGLTLWHSRPPVPKLLVQVSK